ncbi:protein TRIGALACTOSYLDIACYLGLYCEROL 4, chloroplastic-like [Rosa rugosa]|uniref:protein TRIGALACTOSYLDIACYLGLYCEROL 4, chloroplastic-like n=1 Tax=Rosa rugosa TaxID=74645 RepID=UPI002B402751|nr:protein TRIGALACTOSYLDIACYLGLYCEROL 4, chloroplastic-like [Rosa rugosa]
MANLRTAMDSAFWDLNVSSPHTLEGSAKAIPGDPFPLDGARASRALRIQQLSLLGTGFPLGIIPSYSPASHKDSGSFSLQSLLLRPATSNWSHDLSLGDDLAINLTMLVNNLEHVDYSEHMPNCDKFHVWKLYILHLSCCFNIGYVLLNDFSQLLRCLQLPYHDITLEAAWPELFIDHKGQYWDVPESISLDLSSLVSESGLRYWVGIHKNSGHPQAVNAVNDEAPTSLMPGLCAKAAFSYEKSRDLWRQKETQNDLMVKKDRGWFWRPSYDVRLKEPHAAVSGIFGGSFAAWFQDGHSPVAVELRGDGNTSSSTKKRSPVSADFFGSICYRFQHGKFRELYGDLSTAGEIP